MVIAIYFVCLRPACIPIVLKLKATVTKIQCTYLSTYAKIEYVSVRTYLSRNRIRTLRILEHWALLYLASKEVCYQS